MTERGAVPGTDPAVADFPALSGTLRRYDLGVAFYYDAYILLPIPPQ